jgi:hypothetical protein
MKIFLIISAIFPWLFAIGLLFAPDSLFSQMGITVTPAIAQMAGAQGAVMGGLGIINFLARNLTGRAVTPVLAGNLAVQVFNLFVLGRAMATGASPMQTDAFSVVIHVVFGGFFAYFLARESKSKP